MEFFVSAAVGAALSAILSRGAPPPPPSPGDGAPVLTARIPVRARGRGAEETVARLDAMIRALDAPLPRR